MGKRRSITLEGLLRFVDDVGGEFLDLSRKEVYRKFYEGSKINLEDYFPSVVARTADKLERKGMVERIETKEGLMIKITDKGKQELLKYKLKEMRPKDGKWDGKWRVVFFDVPEEKKSKRDVLRDFLLVLGMKRMQDSVFIGPYDVMREVRYLREYLGVPHGVKLGVLESLENADDLKEIFNLE